MNTIPIEKIFEEIGRLHIQISIQQQQIATLEAELASLKAPKES